MSHHLMKDGPIPQDQAQAELEREIVGLKVSHLKLLDDAIIVEFDDVRRLEIRGIFEATWLRRKVN